MSYKDGILGYREDILKSRAVIKKNIYALIPHEGLVNNKLPGFLEIDSSILSSPRLGANFVDYILTLHPDGKNKSGFGGDGIETFAYVIEGKVDFSDGQKDSHFKKGEAIYMCHLRK